MTRLLGIVTRAALAHPTRTVLAVVLFLIALSALAPSARIDLSFSGLMDRSHPEVARYFRASERFGLGGTLLLQLEGPEPELPAALDAVLGSLDGREDLRSVVEIPPPAGPIPGSRLLRVVLTRDPFESDLDSDDFPRLRATVAAALSGSEVEAHFAGMAAIITEEQEATLERMPWLVLASLALVALLLSRVESRLSVLAAAGGTLALCGGATLGLVGSMSGELTLMESLFGVLIFGLGADFAIHWLLRAREERTRGASIEDAALLAVEGTGRGIVAGAVTSGGAFLLLALAPEPVFQRLGISGGVGLILSMVALLLILPAAWSARERRGAGSDRMPTLPSLGAIARASANAPGIVLLACLAIAAASVLLHDRFHYETNLERIFSRDIEAVAVAHEVRATYGIDTQPWIVAAPDTASARQLATEFEASETFERALIEPGPDGTWLVQAFSSDLRLDAARAAVERRVAQSIDPEATSMAAIFEALIGTDRPWMPQLTALVAAFVMGLLLLDLRSAALAGVAIVPVVVGSLTTFALLCAIDFAWNTVTLVGLPLLLGLGVDDGIHLAHRIREQPGRPIGDIVESVGPAIAMTTATTCASVATLLLSRHPGIESLAVLLLVGLPACLLASLTALPAAASALGLGCKAMVDQPVPTAK